MFRIVIKPGNNQGYEIGLADYAECRNGEPLEKVSTMMLRRFTNASLQHAFADELANFTGFDVENDKGVAMAWSDRSKKYLTSKDRSRVDREDEDDSAVAPV